MDLAVVSSTHWNGKLVADFAPKRSTLNEAQMMGIRRLSRANQARPAGNELDVIAVTNPARLREIEHGLVYRF